MPLSAEEQKLLDELTAKAAEPETAEMWIRDDAAGKTLRVTEPGHVKKLLKQFGLDDDDPGDAGDGDGNGDAGDGKPKGEPKPPSTHRFFK